MKATLILLLGISLALPIGGQQSSSTGNQGKRADQEPEEEVVRISTNLVQVDVVVTDKDGRQVTDLRADDFEIFEDGRPQRITNFSYINAAPTTAPTPASGERKDAIPIPPARIKPERVRRTIAIIVDDLNLSFESVAFVRDALKKFVRDQVQPGDLVAIVRTSAGVGALQQFTTDKAQLYAAIERIRWYPLGTGGISPFEPIGGSSTLAGSRNDSLIGQSPSAPNDQSAPGDRLDEFRAELFAVGTLGALNFVVRGLRELPGRKAIVLVSDGFRVYSSDDDQDRRTPSVRVFDALKRLIDLANRASVVIYTIDARGLQTLGLTAADDVRGMTPEQIERELSDRRLAYFESQDGLNYLAQETGGLFLHNTNDIAGSIKRALEDQSGYYLIGYRPDEKTFDQNGQRRFHRITVRVRRSGLQVRSRRGFYGMTDEEAYPNKKTPGERLMAALVSPFSSGELNLRLTSLFLNDAKLGSFMRSLLYIDGRDVTWTPADGDWQRAVIDVLAITFDGDGRPVDRVSRTYTLRARGKTLDELKRYGLVYTLSVPVKKPGAYQLRLAMRDVASDRIGSASQFIQVPDLKKDRLALSGLIVTGRSLLGAAKEPNGSLSSTEEEQAVAVDSGPAVRRFRQGATIDYGFIIYNAKVDKATGHPHLQTQVRLFRDQQPIFIGRLSDFYPTQTADPKRISAAGQLRFGKEIVPGEYVLQIVVTDMVAKDRNRTATQWTDFEVIEIK